MIRIRRQRRGSGVLVLALLALVLPLSACSASPGGGANPLANREDTAKAKAECMADKGWDVTVEGDGGISFSGTADQLDSYKQALKECNDATGGSDVARDVEVTDDMLREAYQMQVDTLACLRDEGYDGLSDPPSLQSYLDSRGKWTPYAELPTGISQADWTALQKQCPQPQLSPPDD